MTGSYRDILARRERKRPDGTSVWPLRNSDNPSRFRTDAGSQVSGESARG
jgi:hypothetical protein